MQRAFAQFGWGKDFYIIYTYQFFIEFVGLVRNVFFLIFLYYFRVQSIVPEGLLCSIFKVLVSIYMSIRKCIHVMLTMLLLNIIHFYFTNVEKMEIVEALRLTESWSNYSPLKRSTCISNFPEWWPSLSAVNSSSLRLHHNFILPGVWHNIQYLHCHLFFCHLNL